LDRDADHFRAVAAQQRERPVVRRRLGEDGVAGLQQAQAEELNQLKRSVAREDAVDCYTLPLGEPLAQRLETKGRPILEHGHPIGSEGGLRRGDHLVDRKGLAGGDSAREIDGLHRRCRPGAGSFR
jgi:hypothetical protein